MFIHRIAPFMYMFAIFNILAQKELTSLCMSQKFEYYKSIYSLIIRKILIIIF